MKKLFENGLSPQKVARSVSWRLKNLQPSLRALARWRGQNPRIYLHNSHTPHPVFRTYLTHPALRYAPYPIAQLCHWVDMLPAQRYLHKPHIFEIEHPFIFSRDNNGWRFVTDWYRVWENREWINELVADDACRSVFTFSAGLADHCKLFLDAKLWPKLGYAYPAFPKQPPHQRPDRPFTILIIASRWSDKGLPEAMRAYEILRERHGANLRLTLVCQVVPENTILPPGVTHINTPSLSPQLKARVYRGADVLFLPCLSETAACFTEAYAFGVPVVTTRIHHGDEFVREGQCGFLVQAPLFPYSEDFGTRWRTAEDFMADLEARRARGELEIVVEESVDRLEMMISGTVDMAQMRDAARAFHAERFSPQARNQQLRAIYQGALSP